MHSKEKYKQGGKTTLRMGENDSKWNNWQRINFQNIEAAHTTQYQENNPIKKFRKDLNRHFSKEVIQIANIWKDAQHHSLLEKCKSKLHWNITNITGEISPVRMAIIKKSTNNKCWRGCGQKRTLLHYWWECKLIQPLWKTVWRFLKNLEIKTPYDLVIPLLGTYLEKTKIEKDT